jgi:RHS repeat-associated protein
VVDTAVTIDGATYTVDPAGNRTAKTDMYANVTSNYTYDPLYELTQVTQATNTTESYSYDPVGNRLSSLGVSPYSVNTSNELTSTPSATYTYDNNGNTLTKVTSAGTTTYGWDYENRLTSVTLPGTGGTLAFKFDGLGRRVQKVFTQNSTSTTTNYLYDGSNAVEDVDQNGNILARYIMTQNVDESLAELRSGTTSYYSQDGLGSVTSLTTSAGALGNTYRYDSFGNLTASSGSIANRYQYTAREFDSETGLYFYRARYYDPNAGRFLNEDTARFAGGADFYVYVGNNAINFFDPLGLCPPTRNQRLAMAGRGLLNIGIGAGKVAGGIGLIGGTGGVGLFAGGYLILTGVVGNVGAGIVQLAGAANGDADAGHNSDGMAAVGSGLGLITLVGTGGNVCKAAAAAKWEGLLSTPFGGGLGVETSIADVADSAQNGYDLVTDKGGCGHPAPKPNSCPQACPK